MYGVPDRSSFAQSSVPFIAAVGCLGLTLLLIAATVILALIPIYTSNKSVPANPNVFRSKEAVMALEIDAGDSTTLGRRRRRQSGGLNDTVGGSCNEDGIEKVEGALSSVSHSYKKIRGFDISKIEFGFESPNLISPNITYKTAPIVMVIYFYIMYDSTCFYPCQVDINPIIQSGLYNMSLDAFNFTQIAIYKNDVFYTVIPTIKCARVSFVSPILAGLSLEVISYPVVTLSPSVTTTTTTTLPTSGSMIG